MLHYADYKLWKNSWYLFHKDGKFQKWIRIMVFQLLAQVFNVSIILRDYPTIWVKYMYKTLYCIIWKYCFIWNFQTLMEQQSSQQNCETHYIWHEIITYYYIEQWCILRVLIDSGPLVNQQRDNNRWRSSSSYQK